MGKQILLTSEEPSGIICVADIHKSVIEKIIDLV